MALGAMVINPGDLRFPLTIFSPATGGEADANGDPIDEVLVGTIKASIMPLSASAGDRFSAGADGPILGKNNFRIICRNGPIKPAFNSRLTTPNDGAMRVRSITRAGRLNRYLDIIAERII